jgi:hypothetical protein
MRTTPHAPVCACVRGLYTEQHKYTAASGSEILMTSQIKNRKRQFCNASFTPVSETREKAVNAAEAVKLIG